MIQILKDQTIVWSKYYASPEEALSAYGRMRFVNQDQYVVLVTV